MNAIRFCCCLAVLTLATGTAVQGDTKITSPQSSAVIKKQISLPAVQLGIHGTVELTPQHPHINNQAGLILNEALYNTLENRVQLNTGSGGTGSYAEVRYYPGDVNATHTIEIKISSNRAATYLVWGQGRYEIPLAAGTQVLRVAIPPNGKGGWHGILLGPLLSSGSMIWNLLSVKITASR